MRLFLLISCIYPFSLWWGIAGVAVAVLVSTFFSAVGFNFIAIRITRCGMLNFGKMTILPLINTAVMIFAIMALKTDPGTINVRQFLLLIGAGLTSYLIVTYLFEKVLHYGMGKIIKEIRSSL